MPAVLLVLVVGALTVVARQLRTEVAKNIDTLSDVNLLYEAKHIVLEFIQKAAEADKTPASEFLSF